ncbi:MAG: ZPR1 zinc finger domain-containing protein [Methanobacteriota archaeon]
MKKREFVLPVEVCPICGAKGTFKVIGRLDDIPYFGETMETLVNCSSCNFKHADVTHLGQREAVRHEFQISSEEDMKVRVVRSSTGTIKVPELGVTIRPGSGSQGYITNIEGVLNRIRDAIGSAKEGASPAKRRTAKRKLKMLEDVVQGRKRAKMIVMDPHGYSAIIDGRTKKRKLTRKEIKALEDLT